MVQLSLVEGGFARISPSAVKLLARFADWRSSSGAARSTLTAEVSQLRSLARAAGTQPEALTLRDLCETPAACAVLIESAGNVLTLATVQTRVRAFTRLLQMDVPDAIGRRRVEAFRAAMPRRPSSGWHDAGVSLPGRRQAKRLPGPTPDPRSIERIVAGAERRSAAAGALAALFCFSGLEVQGIAVLRWEDLTWRDDGETPHCSIASTRLGKPVGAYLVGPGTRALLRWALTSGLDRRSYVFPGRRAGTAISLRALRERMREECVAGGWPRATRSQLLSALAAWLREHGIDDHAIRVAIGRRRVASVDRLMRRQEGLTAQVAIDRTVRESR